MSLPPSSILSGLLICKSLGHIIRVSAAMHVLFNLDLEEEELPATISDAATMHVQILSTWNQKLNSYQTANVPIPR